VPPCPFPSSAGRRNDPLDRRHRVPVITPDGTLREVVVVHHDITELKEAEETMRRLNEILEERVATRTAELAASEENLRVALDAERQLNQLKTAFVGMVSHEFRTPLGIIQTATELLDRHHDRLRPEQRDQYTGTILTAVRRMTAMMEHILLLARIDSRKIQRRPQPRNRPRRLAHPNPDEIQSTCPSRDLCACRAKTATPPAPTATSSASTSIPPPNSAAPARRIAAPPHRRQPLLQRLQILAARLARRGLPHLPAPHTSSSPCAIHGCGIPEDEQPHLFDGFFRGSNVGNTPGTGLGLAITRRCVELLGGAIAVDSAAGQGTTFTVTLPLAPP
jgi:signal transduction histidine kinase